MVSSQRYAVVVLVSLIVVSAAHAALPTLLVADTSFAPEALLSVDLQATASQMGPSISLEGLELVPVRAVADKAGLETRWDASSHTVLIETPAGPMHLRALPVLDFWKDPVIRAGTGYMPRTETVVCDRIVDGDTIKLSDGRRVRYIGVDTPETKHPSRPVEYYGRQASRYNHRLVAGRHLVLEYDMEAKDKYGRTLAYVHSGDIFVNALLVADGYAQVSTYPPNVRYASLFRWLQARARERGVGLWSGQSEKQSAEPTAAHARFVGSEKSDVYHWPDCRWAKRIKPENRVWFESPADARNHGYRPCKVCNPPAN